MKHVFALILLFAVNLLVKYSLWMQPPQTFTDSLSYIAPAINLLDGRGYGAQETAYRTPTYPLFIAAILSPFEHPDLSRCRDPRVPACLGDVQSEPSADANLRAIVLTQIILGWLTILLIYFFAWRVAKNSWVAALCALLYPLDLSTGYWEISILTEALTTFLLALAAALMVVTATATENRRFFYLLLGSTLAALALSQPIYLLYALVCAAFLWLVGLRDRQHRTSSAMPMAVIAIPILAILLWSARNYYVDGFFTPSSLSGYNLTQMVGPFMELAPEEYRDLAEIYVATRRERVPIRGTHSGTIFFAYREMLEVRETTWAGLSRDLTDLSFQLILRNPPAYLQVARDAFDQFWKFGLGRQNPNLPASFDWVKWFFDTRFQQALAILFWLTPIGLLVVRGSELEAIWVWFAIATVWYVALFSSALNFGDNERYRVPVARFQYTVIILTAWALVKRSNFGAKKIFYRRSRRRRGGR